MAQDKLEEYLAQGGFYTALAEFLVDLPMFPFACMKGPTVRIKTQVKWTKDVSPFPSEQQYARVGRAGRRVTTSPQTDLPIHSPPLPSGGPGASLGPQMGNVGAGGVTPE